jgi:hypothetical protein
VIPFTLLIPLSQSLLLGITEGSLRVKPVSSDLLPVHVSCIQLLLVYRLDHDFKEPFLPRQEKNEVLSYWFVHSGFHPHVLLQWHTLRYHTILELIPPSLDTCQVSGLPVTETSETWGAITR